jgi:hypothetical protein
MAVLRATRDAVSPSELEGFSAILASVRSGLLAEVHAGRWPGHANNPSPASINDGLCEVFGQRVLQSLPPSLLSHARCAWIDGLPTDPLAPSHYVIFFAHRCYDAECIEGVSDLRLLPFFSSPRLAPSLIS